MAVATREIWGDFEIQIAQSDGERESAGGKQLSSPRGLVRPGWKAAGQASGLQFQVGRFGAILEFKSPKSSSRGNRTVLRETNGAAARLRAATPFDSRRSGRSTRGTEWLAFFSNLVGARIWNGGRAGLGGRGDLRTVKAATVL